MTTKQCIDKFLCRRAVRRYTITTSVLILLLIVAVFALSHPWEILPVTAFVVVQVGSIITIVFLKFCSMLCIDPKSRMYDSI